MRSAFNLDGIAPVLDPVVAKLILCGLLVCAAAWLAWEPDPPPAPFHALVLLGAGAYPAILTIVLLAGFVATNQDLARADAAPLPPRFGPMVMTATILTAAWFAWLWSSGLQFHGRRHVITMLAVNAAILALLWIGWFWLRRGGSTGRRLAYSTLFHAWLVSCAFPYFGEYP